MSTRQKRITVPAVLRVLSELPADAVNPGGGCQYTVNTPEGVKHCIAGEVLSRLGHKVPGEGTELNTATCYLLLAGRSPKQVHHRAVRLLAEVQVAADGHLTWGSAIRHGKITALRASL